MYATLLMHLANYTNGRVLSLIEALTLTVPVTTIDALQYFETG